ncbi:DNA (cytosine-5)-methyltransferase 1 [Prevotella sp. ne3005]|uniref:DNA (cytosine-5-)-methyltransferase n=1 Tax=Prevotella sp. ne3005 TaxID=1761887 RepID=UPI0008C08F55|nr:DNA (cytosine-5)-methyltransferase 1 [Prevotella sp. ne3005]
MTKEILKKPIPDKVKTLIDYAQGEGYCNNILQGEATAEELLAILTHCTPLMPQKGVEEWQREMFRKACDYVYNAYEKIVPLDFSKVSGIAAESPLELDLFRDVLDVPFPAPEHPTFTFIDLFAGMGGFRLAMQAQGGKCVFSSEWNTFSQKTYFANFGDMPFGDITKEVTKSYIPDRFDVLCAGFPCQPFSIAGVSKKKSLGRETGFKDKTQGTLFFDVADIISRHRPKAFYLENVKNLTSHDKGNTFRVIKETLEELNYSLHYLVMDGQTYVPQHRERIMIVGFDKERYHGEENFEFPEQHQATRSVKEILDPNIDPKYTLSDKLWEYLQNYAEKHRAKGNGFGYGLVDLNGITRTLSARYYKDGSEILIPQEGKNPRRLSPRECARLMGYPDEYMIDKVSDVQAYRQCGNSVIVPLITAVSENIIKCMEA